MIKPYLLVLLGTLYLNVNGQIISQFDFDSNPVTNAIIGPNASSISTSATSSPGGVGGTNGLNAGLPKMDIDMVIPGSPTFDVNGIDVSFDFQRDENGGTFFERGNSLRMNGISNLSVQYRVDDGVGGYNVVNSGNIYALPNDNTFRNYRFIYTPCDGVGMVMVDGVVIWTNDGPDNRNMYWVGAGDVEFGRGMDGTGSNRTLVDNLIVGSVDCSPLPVDFLSLTARLNQDRTVDVNWHTTTEINSSHFIAERRDDHSTWDSIGYVMGAGNSTQPLSYSIVDKNPLNGITYYRVKQVDFDGNYSFSSIASVHTYSSTFTVHPNPSSGIFVIDHTADEDPDQQILIYNAIGKLILNQSMNQSSTTIDIREEKDGIYFVRMGNSVVKVIKN
tara:strand:+ start:106154 stop:107320 length:1167 start_codon:yes stop_codon:yes gene_type:complete